MSVRKRYLYLTGMGSIVALAGLVSTIGWVFRVPQLKGIIPGLDPINLSTAAVFLLAGTWLVLHQFKNKPASLLLVLCAQVTVIGAFQFIALNFFPQVRFNPPFVADSHDNLAMELNTAVTVLLSGVAMLTTAVRIKWVQLARQIIIIASFSIVYLSLLGYIFDVHPACRINGFTPMALTTALVFLVFNVGLFLSNTGYWLAKTFTVPFIGGRLLRRLIPLMLILPALTGYLRTLGERRGFFSAELGGQLHTLVFTAAIFGFIILFAALENKRQSYKIQAKMQLAANERKLRTLFNTIKDGIVNISEDGKIIYCNPGFCSITGYAEEELLGKHAIKTLVPDSEYRDLYRKMRELKKGNKETHQVELIKKTGERIWVAIKSQPIINYDGTGNTVISTITDITEEKLKMQDLQAFTSSAAHDLNAPLARIMMIADVLKTKPYNDEQKFLINSIAETTASMRQLLQELLLFSKLGAEQLEKTDLDLNRIVKDILNAELPTGFKGQVIADHLPSAKGNEQAIKQLYTNLISNAIKYSSKKDFSIVETGSLIKNEQTIYYVKDNGIGLDDEQIQGLFTPFKRFHYGYEGNGLGLVIVKRIVEKHGGKIWVESALNEGTTFYFTLSHGINTVRNIRKRINTAA